MNLLALSFLATTAIHSDVFKYSTDRQITSTASAATQPMLLWFSSTLYQATSPSAFSSVSRIRNFVPRCNGNPTAVDSAVGSAESVVLNCIRTASSLLSKCEAAISENTTNITAKKRNASALKNPNLRT